jgi:hypothetical protein
LQITPFHPHPNRSAEPFGSELKAELLTAEALSRSRDKTCRRAQVESLGIYDKGKGEGALLSFMNRGYVDDPSGVEGV